MFNQSCRHASGVRKIQVNLLFLIVYDRIMDLSAQIKNSLIERIKQSENLDLLKAIQAIFDTSDENIYELNEHQKKSISLSKIQIEEGNVQKSEEVILEMKKWLQSK